MEYAEGATPNRWVLRVTAEGGKLIPPGCSGSLRDHSHAEMTPAVCLRLITRPQPATAPSPTAAPSRTPLRFRVLPSVGTGVRVAAMDPSNHAVLVWEIEREKFDAKRVSKEMERVAEALGLGQLMRPRLAEP